MILDSIGSAYLGKFSSRILQMSTEVPVGAPVKEEAKDSGSLLGNGSLQMSATVPIAAVVKDEVNEDGNPLKRVSEDVSPPVEPPAKKTKLKKKKVAMLISYCGQGYHGMQINHGFKTIEGELFDVFLKMGIMDEEAHKTPNLVQFQRAARTDKGVNNINLM